MELWDPLYVLLQLMRGRGRHIFELDEPLQSKVVALAAQEQRPLEDVKLDLLQAGLAEEERQKGLTRQWQSLSTREQQVAALACLGYTNRQIAARLVIAKDTVSSHMRNLLAKFNLHGKDALRDALSGWDFSEWEKTL